MHQSSISIYGRSKKLVKRDALKIFSFKDHKKIDKCKYISRLAEPDVFGQISHRPGSYDLDRIASRVAEIYKIEVNDIFLVGYSVERGEIIARENDYQLIE